MKTQQSGFTLVEIAIVLVIIGLLLGGVLKGQELINSAKAKSVINDFRNVSVMINSYQDRFRALPGDDAKADKEMTNAKVASTTPANVGNGKIDGAWDSKVKTDETYLAWQHLRLANLSNGATDIDATDYQQKNADGGVIGFQTGAPAGADATKVQGRIFACQSQISGRIAQQVDATVDNDRDVAAGSVFVLDSLKSGFASAPLADGDFYIVCMGF
ncbi:MAG TPA: prepilin-type N-terminal cleavage/methylation domain-containing protein [Rhodocyclaceae bacterium]|nr:prepilin-type N-terminal cleavage/methylation domain-containing protein [Rhodocyclaceae bacterium]